MSIEPMKTRRVGPFVDRYYRETSRFQWARELAVNAIEAGASRIDFSVEWQGVGRDRVYRRLVADNGRGMSADELEEFFNEFGGGGKPIGDEHENFGIGAKTTLLPWNRLGIVVISWQSAIANMIRILREENGEYGLYRFVFEKDGECGVDTVVEPFFDTEFGIDWAAIKPEWIKDHGTVIVLLGNDRNQDTVRGDPDPDRKEDGLRLLAQYLNQRFWQPPAKISVLEFTNTDKTKWSTRQADAGISFAEAGYMMRPVYGTRHFVADQTQYNVPMQSGTVRVPQAEIDWYLWEPSDRAVRDNRGPRTGGTCILYNNELYDWDTGLSATTRAFGICERQVSDNLWIVIRPPWHGPGQKGVYSRADRSHLMWSGGYELPMDDWSTAFANNMPAPIIDALKRARKEQPSSIEDDKWLERLAQRFGHRLKLQRYKVAATGVELSDEATMSVTEDTGLGGGGSGHRPGSDTGPGPGIAPGPRPRRRVQSNVVQFAPSGNTQKAVRVSPRLGMPNCVFSDDPVDLDNGVAAAWTGPSKDQPHGLIKIWRGHPLVANIVRFFQKDYAGHAADKVREIVEQCYREVMVCRVSQSEEFIPLLGRKAVEEMRSPRSLTFSLGGMIGEDAMIRQRLVASIGRKRKPQDAKDNAA